MHNSGVTRPESQTFFGRFDVDMISGGREFVGRGMQSSVYKARNHEVDQSTPASLNKVKRVIKLPHLASLVRWAILTGNPQFATQRYKLGAEKAREYFNDYFLPTRVFAFHSFYPIIIQQWAEFTPLNSDCADQEGLRADLKKIAEISAQLFTDTGYMFDLLGGAVFGLVKQMEQDSTYWTMENIGLLSADASGQSRLTNGVTHKLCLFDLGMIQLRHPATAYDYLARAVCKPAMLQLQNRLNLVFIPQH